MRFESVPRFDLTPDGGGARRQALEAGEFG